MKFIKSNNKNYTKICPKCANIDFQVQLGFAQMLAPSSETCNKCNYTGLFPEIDIKEIENFRKELKILPKISSKK
ncbi:MAG TPA: hypothetical protein VI564_06850 [Candidatus Nanoarchaeia archaeon]|nr:hypothetical protein [Candidatus Nanoarchaeia archaeon]